MNLKFFCNVISKNEDHYLVELNAFNMAELPSGNTTTRKVYSATELPIGIIYVSNSMLELTDTTKRLTILEFYNVVKNNVVVQDKQVEVVPHTPLLSEEIKRMILDSSFVPADIYK
jgi:hypothetical protein